MMGEFNFSRGVLEGQGNFCFLCMYEGGVAMLYKMHLHRYRALKVFHPPPVKLFMRLPGWHVRGLLAHVHGGCLVRIHGGCLTYVDGLLLLIDGCWLLVRLLLIAYGVKLLLVAASNAHLLVGELPTEHAEPHSHNSQDNKHNATDDNTRNGTIIQRADKR